MVVVDAVARLLPGVLGDEQSTRQDSFSGRDRLVEGPQYTRPLEVRDPSASHRHTKASSGSRETFTVRRIVAGEGVERKFPLHSPKIAIIQVNRSGVARRAKLYYLRDRSGKSTRLWEKREETAGEPKAAGADPTRRMAIRPRRSAR